MTTTYDKLYIGGRWVDPAGTGRIEVRAPHNDELVGSVPEGTPPDIDRAVESARRAFDTGPWPNLDVTERIAAVRRFADLYAAKIDDLAQLITAEMGSPITFSKLAQSFATSMLIGTFLDLAERHPWVDHRPNVMGGETLVRRLPVGVVAAIVPWNVPQVVAMSKLVPALLAGCTVVMKPSPETPLDAFLVAELLEQAGLPEGVVSIVPSGPEVGEHLVRHPGVDKVAFTGSTATGRRIAELCGAALKRVSLELGGKSAAILLDDADIDRTVQGLRFASFMNTGQACAAQTRILAPARHYDEVVEALAAMASSLAIGDPFEEATEIGPLVSPRQQARVSNYIGLGQADGAKAVVGGLGPPPGVERGWYVRPTVFAEVDNGMSIAQEEIFGPVICVIRYRDDAEAIAIANDSPFGLGGSVWTADTERGMAVANRIRTGTVGINHYGPDFGSPFGGFKASGIGREYGPEGLDEFVELQSVGLLRA
ncbi:MAG TPA: aldehyde dehydrogenase [Acidimicrobiales bacterium]|jgi:betaine-aldehyde dehydrogenase